MRVEPSNEGVRAEPLPDGKVWLRGDAEPKDWTLTLTDTTPNTHGSPGLWGFSNDHEIYYANDNLVVTPQRVA